MMMWMLVIDYIYDGIYMNVVDIGWVIDEDLVDIVVCKCVE